MEVILTQPVRKLGKVGDTVSVKNGYGRNYLIPQELAIRATAQNVAMFEEQKKVLEEKNAKVKKEAEVAVKLLAGKTIIFVSQASADGRLFGSISTKQIADRCAEIAKFAVSYSNILLDTPIKATGAYNVTIALHADVTSTISVVVAKTESEAQEIIQTEKESAKSQKAEKASEAKAMASSEEAKDAEVKEAPADE